MDKKNVECQDCLELDACMTGCGAFAGKEFYAEVFPEMVLKGEHTIVHLELLNVVVALKMWALEWSKKRVRVSCDNTNACLAIQSGRSRDDFMQKCVRELFLWCGRYDVELVAVHCPGVKLVRADALSKCTYTWEVQGFGGKWWGLEEVKEGEGGGGVFSNCGMIYSAKWCFLSCRSQDAEGRSAGEDTTGLSAREGALRYRGGPHLRYVFRGRRGLFLRPPHVRDFVKEGYFFVPRYEVWGSESPKNPWNIRSSDAEWLLKWLGFRFCCRHLLLLNTQRIIKS